MERQPSSVTPQDPSIQTGQQLVDPPAVHRKFLLLCLSKSNDTLRLLQLDVGSVRSDVLLFRMLQSEYLAYGGVWGRWFSPRKIVSVKFRKVIRTT